MTVLSTVAEQEEQDSQGQRGATQAAKALSRTQHHEGPCAWGSAPTLQQDKGTVSAAVSEIAEAQQQMQRLGELVRRQSLRKHRRSSEAHRLIKVLPMGLVAYHLEERFIGDLRGRETAGPFSPASV